MNFNILRNQLNNSYHMIRPITSQVISEAISAMERHNEDQEEAFFALSSVISRLSYGLDSDVRIISEYIDDNRVANSISIPIFENLLNRMQNQNNVQAAG